MQYIARLETIVHSNVQMACYIMDMIFCWAKNLIHVMGKVGRKAGLICIGEY